MARRPSILNPDADKPVIVALHGAGVEAGSKFWITSIPQQKYSWVRKKHTTSHNTDHFVDRLYFLQEERLGKLYTNCITVTGTDIIKGI